MIRIKSFSNTRQRNIEVPRRQKNLLDDHGDESFRANSLLWRFCSKIYVQLNTWLKSNGYRFTSDEV